MSAAIPCISYTRICRTNLEIRVKRTLSIAAVMSIVLLPGWSIRIATSIASYVAFSKSACFPVTLLVWKVWIYSALIHSRLWGQMRTLITYRTRSNHDGVCCSGNVSVNMNTYVNLKQVIFFPYLCNIWAALLLSSKTFKDTEVKFPEQLPFWRKSCENANYYTAGLSWGLRRDKPPSIIPPHSRSQ